MKNNSLAKKDSIYSRAVSLRIQEIISQLGDLAGQKKPNPTAIENALRSARENGSYQIIPSLLPFIFPKDENRLHKLLRLKADGAIEEIQQAALRAAHELLRNTSVVHLPQLDASIRTRYGIYQDHPMGGWLEANVARLKKIDCSANERKTALQLLTAHPNGFVREHAP